MSNGPKKWRVGCRLGSDEEEPAREGAGGHNGSSLRLKRDLLAVIKREGEMLQDALANGIGLTALML
jgi:hypothetical protein